LKGSTANFFSATDDSREEKLLIEGDCVGENLFIIRKVGAGKKVETFTMMLIDGVQAAV